MKRTVLQSLVAALFRRYEVASIPAYRLKETGGVFITGGPEQAVTVLQNSPAAFTGTTAGNGVYVLGDFNVSVWGVFVGTAVVEQSADGGVTWVQEVNRFTNQPVSFTVPGALSLYESEPGIQYRLRCSAFTSGTINWRIAAGTNREFQQAQRLT